MSVISPVKSHDHEGSPVSKEEKLRWERSVEKVIFEPGVKKWRSDESGDDDRDELKMAGNGRTAEKLKSGWGGEPRQNWLADEMNLEVDFKDEIIHNLNERSVTA